VAVGVVLQQPFARVRAVDESEVGRWPVEAEKFLEALRKLADLTGIGAPSLGSRMSWSGEPGWLMYLAWT